MNAIETTGLSKNFGRKQAVHDLTMNVPEGAIFAFLGPNGAGKTTTIKMLLGLLSPDEGKAHVLGSDCQSLRKQDFQKIGYVSEGQSLPEGMTVDMFLKYCRRFYPSWDDVLAKTLQKSFNLPPETKLHHLSRGMRMKTMLLSSLAYRPRLLILDEPFSGLDALVREELVQGMIQICSEEGVTILVSSHDIDEVERFADHVGIINDGHLRILESVESLQSRFRQMVGHVDRIETIQKSPRREWLLFESSGEKVQFVDAHYHPQKNEDILGARMEARPMSLKEIYLALAKSFKTNGGMI